ncbi:hypothetical protein BK662_23820 [Pseudomonas frederiksbergensis]|uniref:FAD dependent oxidoreductase domain-containing protein n=1 Tax=Pseudomonas frederiksbergensis TaxID=104087 RepID=A0A423HLX6_9PSED|nr:hypothetical protein BK662_18875 [Pseudomonas frederiksbergensis]RON14152.1 hypothetical protein BK662_23820 [Pseudomonas frederiksbergensis]
MPGHSTGPQTSGIALSGGYGGEGVGASNLGGRTLADLILQRDTELVRQPWVIPQGGLDMLKAWEPEPCRWLGYNAIIRPASSPIIKKQHQRPRQR